MLYRGIHKKQIFVRDSELTEVLKLEYSDINIKKLNIFI